MASRDQSPAAWRNLPIPCALSCKMDQIGGGVLQRKPQQISDFGSVEVDILLVSFRHMPFFPKFLMFLHTGWWTITLKNLYCLILSVKMECFTKFLKTCLFLYPFISIHQCFSASLLHRFSQGPWPTGRCRKLHRARSVPHVLLLRVQPIGLSIQGGEVWNYHLKLSDWYFWVIQIL